MCLHLGGGVGSRVGLLELLLVIALELLVHSQDALQERERETEREKRAERERKREGERDSTPLSDIRLVPQALLGPFTRMSRSPSACISAEGE